MFGLFEKTKNFEELTASEFSAQIKEDRNATILDVRTSGEFMAGYIPGAVNIDLMSDTFNAQISKLDKTRTYYVYCRSGSRSAQACSLLANKGYKAFNLADGIIGWQGDLSNG